MPRKAKKPEPRLGAQTINLRDPDVRVALPYLSSPMWHRFDLNRSLGYGGNRRHPGSWYAKIIVGKTPEGKEDRRQVCLGYADDLAQTTTSDPRQDGADPEAKSAEELPVLTYSEALAAAVAWCEAESKRGPKNEAIQAQGALAVVQYRTIGDAMDAYFKHLNIPDDHSRKNTFQRIELTKSQIGSLVIATLTRIQLDDWKDGIVSTPPRIRSKHGKPPAGKPVWDATDPENRRARMVTANRALADVKAALNYTLGQNGATSSLAWDTCKAFVNVDKSRGDAMTPAEVIRFLNSCLPEFRPLAYGTILLGGRYGELTKLLVEDFNPRQKVMHFRAENTKTKKARYAPLTDEAVAVFMEICRGREPKERIFVRANGKPWGKSQQHKPMKDSTKLENIDACFYGLRHTRISQYIEDGIAIGLVGESVGTSENMIRRHYKHLLPESVQKSVNSKSRNIGLSQARIDQTKRELEALAQQEVDEMPELNFKPESLHPSNYLGKVKGGSEPAPPPRPKPTREELAALLAQNVPASKIGEMFGFSGTMIARWCKAYGIKKPGRGYHAKQRAKEKR